MKSTHSLIHLKHYHNEGLNFFGSQLILLKESISKITGDRLSKAAILLISCGQTGTAIIQLANQPDTFTRECAMLSRAFMETMTNFCYAAVCDEKEYRAFLLHPVYKHYHNVGFPKMEDDLDLITVNAEARKEKQESLKKIPTVQEALGIFSDTKANLNWTKKKLHERIETIEKYGKLMDVFFTINKIQYYSDASEALHGSLYGCTYNIGVFEKDFDLNNKEELNKRLYKDSACILLHLGMLIHESLTLISYANPIEETWDHSYKNRGQALSLLLHILEIKLERLSRFKK